MNDAEISFILAHVRINLKNSPHPRQVHLCLLKIAMTAHLQIIQVLTEIEYFLVVGQLLWIEA